MKVIAGTAGHIDHGKTALIKALTGTDADRLPEEKQRGITVDLGFAEMSVGDVHIGFVDVPGHERFVKNMLAGASGIDIVLLVIAADEGVMPQTREHFEIVRLLAIRAGLVVLTKTDLVDAETLDLARLDAAELVANSFLEYAPVVCISSRSGDGIESLRTAIVSAAATLPKRSDQWLSRLPIDRSFSMKGFGAVVTGTLASGKITEGAEMELLPTGARVRVRGLQTHGNAVKQAEAGQRVAVNLGGIDHSKVERGMVLTQPNVLNPTQLLDAEIEVLQSAPGPVRSRQRVRVHIGTVEALARVHVLNDDGSIAPGETDLVQLRLEKSVAAVPGERFIIRSYSPQVTIGGGAVLDAMPSKHRRKDAAAVREHLAAIRNASDDNAATISLLVEAAGVSGTDLKHLQARTALQTEILKAAVDENVVCRSVVRAGERLVNLSVFDRLERSVEAELTEFHRREPLAKGIRRDSLSKTLSRRLPNEVYAAVIESLASAGKIVAEQETVRLVSHSITLSGAEAAISDKIRSAYKDAALEVPKLLDVLTAAVAGTQHSLADARKYFQLFLDCGEIVKVTDEFYFTRGVIDALADVLKRYADGTADRLIDVRAFKELARVSRKYAIPLLEYFDRERVTRRSGDKRLIL